MYFFTHECFQHIMICMINRGIHMKKKPLGVDVDKIFMKIEVDIFHVFHCKFYAHFFPLFANSGYYTHINIGCES